MHFNKALLFLLIWVAPYGARAAGTIASGVEETIDRFEKACTLAFSDVDEYLSTVELPGPSSENFVADQRDEGVISIFNRLGNIYDEIDVYTIESTSVVDCVVIGEFYDFGHDDLKGAFMDEIANRTDLSLSGGSLNQYHGGSASFFVAKGIFNMEDLVTVIHLSGSELQLHVQKISVHE